METSTSAEPTVAGLEAEFPGWHVWHGVSGLWYARRMQTSPPWVMRGEDLMDLRDALRGWLGRV